MKTLASQNKLMPAEQNDLIDPPVMNGGGGINIITPIDGIAVKPVGYAVEGTTSNDTLYGSALADDMFGGWGHDTLYGRAGNDRLYGDEGLDTLDGGLGADLLDGGAGQDTASYRLSSQNVTVDLSVGKGYFGDAEGDTYVSIEAVVGSNFADRIIGNAVANVLNGGGGDDQIVGGAGADVLIGGAGRDILTGDMPGIFEADVFVFTRDSGLDTITDFQSGFDHIDVTAFGHGLAAFGPDGALATGTFDNDGNLIGARGLSEGDRFFYDTRTGILWECTYRVIDSPFLFEDDIRILKLTNAIAQVDPHDAGRLSADDLIVGV